MKDVAQFFKVLADEARLEMLWLLFNHQELCVCDLMAALDITQSKASRHLATLRYAGLVVDRREAAWSYYSLRPVKNELERAQLELLRSKLAEHPRARQLLRDLHSNMSRKGLDLRCTTNECCTPSQPKARRARGGTRAGATA